MKDPRRALWIPSGVALASAAILALTGWGIFLTGSQGRQLEKVPEAAARSAVEGRIERIETGIAAREIEILQELSAIATLHDPRQGAFARQALALVESEPLIRAPFWIDALLEPWFPPAAPEGDAPGGLSPLLVEESAPDDFTKAMSLLWSGDEPDAAARSIDAVSRAPELAPIWRFRALCGLASLRLRQGQAPAAAAIYERTLREFQDLLDRRATRPSRLQVTLALANALDAAGERPRAAALLEAALAARVEGDVEPWSGDEEAFFAHSVEEFFGLGATGASRPDDGAAIPRVRRLLDRQRLRQELYEVAGAARSLGILSSRLRLVDGEAGLPHGRRRAAESLGGERRVFVWAPGPVPFGGQEPLAAVGFQLDLAALVPFVDKLLASLPAEERGGLDLRAFAAAGAPAAADSASSAPSAPLSGDLGAVAIGIEPESWRSHLREGRRPYHVAGWLIPALGLGSCLALLGFYRGIRRERHLSRLKTDFVANVSHELKTPLALIRLFGETLSLDRVVDESRKKEYYGIITRESERLTLLINNVLDFASIEAGRKTYDLSPTDLAAVVEDTVRAYQYHLEQNGFALEVSIAPDLPAVLADADAVSQALINLLNNAVKYSIDSKDVRVRVAAVDGAGADAVTIAVVDRGVGIPAEDLTRIFEGFYRSRAARELGRRGSGLGLSLVRHIMRSHGGRVDVASAPGAGSTFTLVFPRHAVSPASPAPAAPRPPAAPPRAPRDTARSSTE